MNTEITENNKGWVLYDGDCPICLAFVRHLTKPLGRRGFKLAPLQTHWVMDRLGLRPYEPPAEMKILTAQGKIYGGADAIIYLARSIWWAWPLFIMTILPGGKSLLRLSYRWLARHRYCVKGGCKS